ncbi:MAG: hypothetical protein FWB91_12000 [Defluviitaleaceae bacterium]|nr:hypothetical protein [Defluviitaleaceae bacterium]
MHYLHPSQITFYDANVAEIIQEEPEPEPVPEIEPEPVPEPEPHESSICLERAVELFVAMDAIFDADGGYMWGVELHGPFMFADPLTRHAVANMPDPQGFFIPQDGVYVGVLPIDVPIGHTMVSFRGLRWGMMAWENSDIFLDPYHELSVVRVMVHEVFHAWQLPLFGQTEGIPSQHLNDRLDARISALLEINALIIALQTTGDARQEAIHTALSLRGWRHANHPGSARIENTFQIHEGVPTYVDSVLTFGFDSAVERMSDMTIAYGLASQSGLPIGFGYVSGELYSLVLDTIGADWRGDLRFDTGLGDVLQEAAGIEQLAQEPLSTLDLRPFGYAEIVAAATAWYGHHQEILSRAEENFLGTQLISVDGAGHFVSHDHLDVVMVQGLASQFGLGTMFYGTFVHEGNFGRLYVTDGMLVLTFSQQILWYSLNATGMEIEGNRVIGRNWEIVLNDGFIVYEQRAGNFRVVSS